jgi:5-methylcytosine-specific restriction endonuclease McrA
MTGCFGAALFGLLWIGINLRRGLDRRRAQESKLARVRLAAERHQTGVISVHEARGVRAAQNLWPSQSHPAIARAAVQYSRGNRPSGLQRHRRVRQLGDAPANRAGTPVYRGVAPARHSTPARLRFTVLQRDSFRCRYCGRTATEPGVVLHVDHIVPVAAGGATSESNLVTACSDCNLGKSTRLGVLAGSFGRAESMAQLDASGLDVMDYDSRWGQYRIRVGKADLTKHKDLLISLLAKAHGGTE